jgi:glutathione S-transferase
MERRPTPTLILLPMAATGESTAATGASVAAGRATLYVIPGSHACAATKLMLERKGITYRTVELPTGLHPQLVRLRGFPGSPKPIRMVDGKPTRMSAMLDRVGTVPALSLGSEKLQRNSEIARFLDRVVPDPPLYPGDPERRAAVEEAEAWADEPLQMFARRLVIVAGARGAGELSQDGGRGRLGALLAGNGPQRRLAAKIAARTTFRANADAERRLLAALPEVLDRADGYFTTGVIGGEEPNVADLMIAPSLALLDYRLDIRDQVRARPAFAVVERLLPEPA